jgi:biotin carboxylase
MKKKLAIIGASFGQKPLCLKAKEMGIETHCFAWDKYEKDFVCKEFADHYYPISVVEKEQILDICKKVQIDGVVTIATDICVPTVSYVAGKMGLIGNDYEDSWKAINKLYQREAFLKHGVSSPLFTVGGENMDLTGFTYPLIVKPADRGSSIGVMEVDREEDLADAVRCAQRKSYTGQAVVEEYITGREVCAECIAWEGEYYIITVTETETNGTPHHTKIAYHQPARLDAGEQARVCAEAKKALKAINFKYGASDVEMKISDEGVIKVVEVNPRMGGDDTEAMVRLSTGYDFVKAAINVAFGKFDKPVNTENKCSGIYFLGEETAWVKQVIENKENDPDIIVAEIFDEQLHKLQDSNDRSGYFIYQSAQRKQWNTNS